METIRTHGGTMAGSALPGGLAAASAGSAAVPAQRDRRMHLRAYNHWANMLHRRRFPTVADLAGGALCDIAANSVLLDVSAGCDSPSIAYLGDRLVEECGAKDGGLQQLADAPEGSLLARLNGHYRMVLANRAPTGFEAEFAGMRGATMLYRGILLPFSSDDETIDFVLVVVNWKELTAEATARRPECEAKRPAEARRLPSPGTMLPGWADGPASALSELADPTLAPAGPACERSAGVATATLVIPDAMPSDVLPASVAENLCSMPLHPLAALPVTGAEFSLALIRRPHGGIPALVGEVPHDPALIAEAARRLAC